MKGNNWGWFGIIFFGFSTILIVLKFFLPHKEIFKSGIFGKEISTDLSEENFNKIYNDNGIFNFLENGFIVKTTKGQYEVKWTDIISMIGYKEDRYVVDCICLDIFCEGYKSFKLTEETPGWFRFLTRSKEALPIHDKSWEIEISTPAFETNLTLIYDKQGRNLEEVIQEFYTR